MRKTIQNTIVLFLVMCIPNHSSEKKAKKKRTKKEKKNEVSYVYPNCDLDQT